MTEPLSEGRPSPVDIGGRFQEFEDSKSLGYMHEQMEAAGYTHDDKLSETEGNNSTFSFKNVVYQLTAAPDGRYCVRKVLTLGSALEPTDIASKLERVRKLCGLRLSSRVALLVRKYEDFMRRGDLQKRREDFNSRMRGFFAGEE